jgi:aubergine
MNAKLGGALWATKPPKRIPITIVIGIDICHQLNKHGKPMSFLGFCASLDCNFTEFYSKAYPIPSNQELVDGLQSCFEQFLLAFITKFEDIIPALIIVYRDGVSDTQQPSVVDYEVPQITDYIQSLQHTKWDPKIIYIIVNKRVNARFYLEIDEGENTREIRGLEHFQEPFISNPNPGTIIDSGIVTSSYDFYLISQSSTRGTITPTHYHVVYNTSQLHPQKLYQLTYKLCFHYYNW